MNAVAPIQPATPTDIASTTLNFVAMAVERPDIDIAKLRALLDMQREIIADERKTAFKRAMSAAQAEMRPVLRDARNTTTSSRYSTYEALDRAIRPIYTKHGFSVTFDSEAVPGRVRIWCEVSHANNHSIIVNAEPPIDTLGPRGTPNKSEVHGWKSAVMYGRRAALELAFNLTSTDDDDGNAAGGGGETGEVIGREQVAELRELIAACSADPQAGEANERHFLTRMQLADLRSIEDVHPQDFARLRTALLAKRERLDRIRRV